MTTTINSNGSKWAGEKPDSIDKLIQVMGKHRLESWSGYEEIEEQAIRFFGNFVTLSHVFDVESDDAIVVARLVAAIERNWHQFPRDQKAA